MEVRGEKQFPYANIDPKRPTFFVSTCYLTSSSTKKLVGTVTRDQKQRETWLL